MRSGGERYNKRGLSPLVATILLIAFAVSLGTMIMSWSIDAGESHEDVCEETSIELQSLAEGDAICYDAQKQHVQFLLKNSGETTVDSFILRVIDRNQQVTEQTARAELTSGGLGSFQIAYQTVSPNNLAATIIPIVSETACPKQEIERTNLPLC